VHLRKTLGLSDGDQIAFSVREFDPAERDVEPGRTPSL
jgi:hypothetical protein